MTYSKSSIFVLLAVIAASLAACSNIEPTIDDYDMYVMVHEIDEETQIPVAKIYKNKTLLFEGEHDKKHHLLQLRSGKRTPLFPQSNLR